MEEKTYYRGYLKVNNYNERIEIVDGEYKSIVNAEHLYRKVKKQPAFDSEGNSLGVFEKEEFFSEEGEKIIDRKKYLVQIGFDFYLLPLESGVTIPDLQRDSRILEDSGFGKFNVSGDCSYELNDIFRMDCDYPSRKQKRNELLRKFNKPEEISIVGHSCNIYRSCVKEIRNFNLKEYENNLKRFIKDNEEYKEDAETLFYVNSLVLEAFFISPLKSIFSNGEIKPNKLLNRVNFNINNKNK